MQNKPVVKLLLDSVSSVSGIRLRTYELKYWRAIHAELMTHRVFSRNAGSSRAKPALTIIEESMTNPWGPRYWGKNQPGMQAAVEHNAMVKIPSYLSVPFANFMLHEYGDDVPMSMTSQNSDPEFEASREVAWHFHGWLNGAMSGAFHHAGYHKQTVNRMTESTSPISVLVTATDFNNWDALRIHGDAQPEIFDLATDMHIAAQESTPRTLKPGEWHLPYIMDEDHQNVVEYLASANGIACNKVSDKQTQVALRMLSAARCARISYTPFDGNASIQKEMERADSLLTFPVHASPFEHQATPDDMHYISWVKPEALVAVGTIERVGMKRVWKHPELCGNFNSWIQHRKLIHNECISG